MPLLLRQNRFTLVGVLMMLAVLLAAGCGGGSGPGGGGGGGSTTVVGVVLDAAKADAPVGGATVKIGDVTAITITKAQANATQAEGSFVLKGAPVGANRATVTAPGQAPQEIAFAPPVAPGTTRIDGGLTINIGQISGQILAPNGQPAARAFVTVLSTGDQVQTDAQGKFFVDLVPAVETEITAVFGTATAQKTVIVKPGLNEIAPLTLVDDPNPNPPGKPSTIIGTVTLFDNNAPSAATGLTVTLLKNGVAVETTTTGANGEYSFYVPAGTYRVKAAKTGYQDGLANVSVTDPSTPVRADISLVH